MFEDVGDWMRCVGVVGGFDVDGEFIDVDVVVFCDFFELVFGEVVVVELCFVVVGD